MIRAWLNDTGESLRVPEFRILWAGSLFATLAFMMSFTVQPVVAFELAGTNRAVGLVNLGMGIAMLLVGPFGGVVADRASKRRLVFVGQFVVALSMLAVGLLLLANELSILLLALSTAVMGLSFSFVGPARQAWVGELVGRAMLTNAVALSQLQMNVSRVGAPLLAGLMLGSAVGAGGTYLFMASLFIVVLATVAMLPPSPGRPADQRRSVRDDLVAGVQHVSRNPKLRLLMALFIVIVVTGFSFQIVLPALLERHLDREATDIGLILTVNAVAALVVNLILAGMVRGGRAWALMLGMAGLMGAGFLMLAVVPGFGLALVAMVLVGPGMSGFMLINNALLMSYTDAAYYGRVMSLTMIAFALQSILSLPWGILADSLGEREMLAISGLLALGVMVVGGFFAIVVVRRTGAAAVEAVREVVPFVPALSAVAAAIIPVHAAQKLGSAAITAAIPPPAPVPAPPGASGD